MYKKIKDYPNYEINEDGVIVSLHRKEKIRLKELPTRKGYLQVVLCKDGKKHKKFVHRLVAQTFLDNPKNKPYVNHIDGNKTNNRLINLEWVTASENKIHSNTIHTSRRGSQIKNTKLTDNIVKEILKHFKETESFKEVQNKFSDYKESTLRSIVSGENWKHVLDTEERETLSELYLEKHSNPYTRGITRPAKKIMSSIPEDILYENERYKLVKGFSAYFVTDHGRIFSMFSGRFLKQTTNSEGYKIITLRENCRQKTFKVHRIVLSAFDEYHENLYVNHIDGDRTNNNLDNLEWVTQQQNMQKAYSSTTTETA
ncbi:MAG: HNH endonuclease signature motif containing protein [Candidatus Dojkabacteria bacterium]